MNEPDVIRIGVSSCLLGDRVRADGTDREDRFLIDELGRFAELVGVCPEIELGMGAPRPPLRMLGRADEPRLVSRDGNDWTRAMERFSHKRVAELEAMELCGYVLKSESPTCGMEQVPVYDAYHVPNPAGVGRFAAVLHEQLPWLPVEEEGRLRDHGLREDFLDAVFALARWRAFVADGFSAGGLVEFHARSKFQLLAHNPALYRDLGRLVADAGVTNRELLRDQYLRKFMAAMRSRASRRRHVNVLQHLAGFVKRRVNLASRRELNQTIRDYQRGQLPRSVPLVLLRHHAREQGVDYVSGQTYFTPFPLRLLLT